MAIRRRKPEVKLDDLGPSDSENDLTPLQFVDWSNLPETELLSEEGRKLLDQAIQSLPEALRMVFVLRDIEGVSIRASRIVAMSFCEPRSWTRVLSS